MKPNRDLGQVFLVDEEYKRKIVEALEVKDKEVVEIGPGHGEISELLYQQVKKLYCVEVDPRLQKLLSNKFKEQTNVEVIPKSILKFSFSSLPDNIIVFGNAPYNISKLIIKHLINYRDKIKTAYLTFQREFVDKLMAKESSLEYSFLSCYIQYYAQIKKLLDIPRDKFSPKPLVDSSLIRIDFGYSPREKASDENFLFLIIQKAFNQRRKKIINSLSELKNKEEILTKLNISQYYRAEELSLDNYIRLANELLIAMGRK